MLISPPFAAAAASRSSTQSSGKWHEEVCGVLLDLFVRTWKKMFKVVIVKLEAMEGEWDHVSLERICMMLGFENLRRNNK